MLVSGSRPFATSTAQHPPSGSAPARTHKTSALSRRHTLQLLGLAAPLAAHESAAAAQEHLPIGTDTVSSSSILPERCLQQLRRLDRGVCYAQPGPLQPLDLPHLEHICTSCFPACIGDKCILNISATYPKGGSLLGLSPPYPLAVFTGGFTINSAAYRSTAARLASWGYTVIRYDTRDALPDVLDDVTCVRLQRELIDWAATHPLMRRLADTRRVYLTGHSRGGKLAALTAAADSRVVALCLLDPVDVTQYAPLSDRFPSAAAALNDVAQTGRFLPVAVVGSGQSGECAPQFNNYQSFYQASPSAAWQVLLPAAGHFQYLDTTTALQRAVCGGAADEPDDSAVREVSQAVMVAWGEAMVKVPGTDVISSIARRCSGISDPSTAANLQSSNQFSGGVSGLDWTGQPLDSGGSISGNGTWLPAHQADVPSMPCGSQQHAAAALSGVPTPLDQQQTAAGLRSEVLSSAQLAPAVWDQLQQRQQRQQERRQLEAAAQSSAETGHGAQQQQQQQIAGVSPLVQTRQEVWLASKAPSPAELRTLKSDLERLLVALSYRNAATLDLRTGFKNFGN